MRKEILSREWLDHLVIIGLIVTFLFIFYRDHILGSKYIPFDSKDQYYPFVFFVSQSYRQGEIPLWNPYIYSGTPSFADPLYMTFYPGLIFALIPRYLSQHWFDLIEIMHIALGGVFIFLFLRDIRANFWSSLIGAVLFMLSGPMAGRVQHVAQIYTTSLIPLVLFLIYRGINKRDIFILGLAGIVLGSALMVGYQVAMLFCLVVGAFFMIQYTQRYGFQRKRVLEGLGLLTFTLAIAGGFSAIQVIPSLEFSRLSNRPSFDYLQASKSSLSPSALFTMIFPNLFGSLGKTLSDFRGPFDITEGYLFIGAAPLYFLWFSMINYKALRGLHKFFLVVALVGLLYALGKHAPIYPFLYHVLPFLRLFKRTSEGLFIYHLGVSIAVALGFDLWNKVENRKLVLKSLFFFLVCYIVLLVWAWTIAKDVESGDYWYFGPNIIAVLFLFVFAILNWKSSLSINIFPPLFFLVIFCDLVVTSSDRVFNATPYEMVDLTRSGIHGCSQEVNFLRVGTADQKYRFEAVCAGSLWNNASAVWRIPSSSGYSPLVIKRYYDFHPPFMGCDTRSFSGLVKGLDSPLFELLGVRYIVTTLSIDQIDPRADNDRFSLILAPCNKIYENNRALPLVFMVHNAVVADQESVKNYLLDPTFDPRDKVIIERDMDTNSQLVNHSRGTELKLGGISDGMDSVSVIRRTNNTITLTVRSASDGILIVNDAYYPGWKAYVDNKPSEVLITNYAFKGVYLPGGEHVVEFIFDPSSFHWGLSISVITVLILLSLGIFRRKFAECILNKMNL